MAPKPPSSDQANLFMFIVQASADETNERFPAGEPHTMLVFVKQDADEDQPNLTLCESIVRNAGWTRVDIQRVAPATPEAVRAMQKSPDPLVDAAYAHAIRHGFRVLVFAAPLPTAH